MHRVGARYTYNIFHQSEFALRMAEAALRDGPPAHVVWPFRLLNFTRQLLELFLPSAHLVVADEQYKAYDHAALRRANATLCDRTREFFPVLDGHAFFGGERDASAVRAAAFRGCRKRHPRVRERRSQRLRLVVIDRTKTSGEASQRNFWQLPKMLASLRRCPAVESVEVRTPSAELSICEQIDLYTRDLDAMLTPHGAHNTFGIFLPPGALLLEGMPWANIGVGYWGLIKHSRVAHHVLYSARPTADDFEFSGEGAQNDLECGKNKDCRYAYRWNAHVHVAADRACRLLGDHARSANRTWPRPVLTLPQLWGSGYWHNPDGEEAAG